MKTNFKRFKNTKNREFLKISFIFLMISIIWIFLTDFLAGYFFHLFGNSLVLFWQAKKIYFYAVSLTVILYFFMIFYKKLQLKKQNCYQILFEKRDEAVIIFQTQKNGKIGHVLKCNSLALDLLGYTQEEILKKSYSDLSPDEKADDFEDKLFKQRITLYDSEFQLKTGIKIKAQIQPLLCELEGFPVFAMIIMPFNKSKVFDDLVRQNEVFFKQLSQNLKEVLWIRDSATRKILFVNPAYEKVWGRSCESLYQFPESSVEAIHPEDRPRILDAIRKQNEGEAFHEEYRILMPDGTIKWLDANSYPVKDESGLKTLRFVGIAEDITEKKQTEEQLTQSEEKYRVVFENTGNPILILEKDLNISLVNEEFVKVSGYSKEEIEGKMNWNDFTVEVQVQKLYDFLPGGQYNINYTLKDYDFHFLTKTGKVKQFKAVISYLSKTRQGVISLVDITEHKKSKKILNCMIEEFADINYILEKKVQENIEEIRKKDNLLHHRSRLSAMGEMIENIAHQWRQPLNSLGLTIQSLKFLDLKEDSKNKNQIDQTIVDSMNLIEHMDSTIDDFRKYFQANKESEIFSIAEVIQKTLKIVQLSFQNQHIAIESYIEKDSLISGFPNQLCHVLINLLTNSKDVLLERKINPAKIEIRVFRKGNNAVITVWDNAGGVDQEILKKLFEPYFTTKEEGSGIGLSMSKTMIEKNMKGFISARNQSGGLLFEIQVLAVD